MARIRQEYNDNPPNMPYRVQARWDGGVVDTIWCDTVEDVAGIVTSNCNQEYCSHVYLAGAFDG